MNKTEFIDAVAKKASITKADARKVVGAFIDTVTESLEGGGNVVLTGFGTFEVREAKARNGVNPRTKEKLVIPATKRPAFRAGAVLKRAETGK